MCAAGGPRRLRFTGTDRLHGTPGEYAYVECHACRSVFQEPMVIQQDLVLCYPPDYSPHTRLRPVATRDLNATSRRGLLGAPSRWVRRAVVSAVRGGPAAAGGLLGRLLALSATIRERAFYGLLPDCCLPHGTRGARALDVGCGTGSMMLRLAQAGWAVEGVEWNERAAQLAADATHATVWTGDFRTLSLPTENYQLVVLDHVLEHISNCAVALQRLYELLAPGGRLVLSYPNPTSWGASCFGSEWFPWDCPRHLVFPAREALRGLAKATGFRTASVRSRSRFTEEQWVRSKAYRLGLHPERDRPRLSWKEMVQMGAGRVGTAMGLNSGWEILAVLTK